MKTVIEFNLPADREDLDIALNAGALYSALFDVRNEIFRPARKHGYNTKELQDLMTKLGDDGVELIAQLETLFGEILEKNELDGFTI
jgi:hypothetical protein